MAVSDILIQFKTQAKAIGVSEEGYLWQEITKAFDTGDLTILNSMKALTTGGSPEEAFFQAMIDSATAVNGAAGAPTAVNVEVQDEGSSLTTAAKKLNFVGAGVAATEPLADEITVTIPGAAGGAIIVEDAGTPVTTAVTKFNFTGAGVTITEPVADEITVDIPGGGGGGGTLNFSHTISNVTGLTTYAGPLVQPGAIQGAAGVVATATGVSGTVTFDIRRRLATGGPDTIMYTSWPLVSNQAVNIFQIDPNVTSASLLEFVNTGTGTATSVCITFQYA
jgi:hypothetical protein